MKNEKLPPLERCEWDFEHPAYREILQDDDRLYFCMVYEYAREVDSIKEAFKAAQIARKKVDRSQFDKLGNWHYAFSFPPGNLDRGARMIVALLNAPHGFPKKPYLTSKHRLKGTNPSSPFMPPPPPLVPAIRQTNGYYIKEGSCSKVIFRGVDTLENGFISVDQSQKYLSHDEVYHFAIDLTATREKNVEAFKTWLFRQPEPEKRNRDSTHWIAMLRFLGAWRLSKRFKTALEAMDYSSKVRSTDGSTCPRLIDSESEWSRAVSDADATIQSMEKHSTVFLTPDLRNSSDLNH